MKKNYKNIREEINSALFERRENNHYHFSYETEKELLCSIKLGKEDRIPMFVSGFQNMDLPPLSSNPLKSKRYMFIVTTSIISRQAIEAGLDVEAAYTASDIFIQKADTCSSPEDLNELYEEMITFYTRELHKLHQAQLSIHVVRVQEYVANHLHSKLTPGEISQAFGLSSSYLTTLFKKETGLSLMQYIHHEKIQSAQNLLQSSGFSFSEISSYLAFSSQSHFARLFKRETGMTPREFKKEFYRTYF